jgi:hypothetical protein
MKDTQEKYNGWANYATWRVNIEMFHDLDQDGWNDSSPDDCKEYAEMLIQNEGTDSGFAWDYAMSFLQNVNWQEIADSLNENA